MTLFPFCYLDTPSRLAVGKKYLLIERLISEGKYFEIAIL